MILSQHRHFWQCAVISCFSSQIINKMTVKTLNVQVTYSVGLGNVEIPQNIYDLLVEAYDNHELIELRGDQKYDDALDWVSNNFRENDCFYWSAEIEELE